MVLRCHFGMALHTHYLNCHFLQKFIFHVWYCCLDTLLNKVQIDLPACNDEDVLPGADTC